MKFRLDCIPCFQRQALQAARFTTDDVEVHKRVLEKVMKELMDCDWTLPPSALSGRIHDIIREESRTFDPYASIKKECNEIALGMMPEMEKMVEGADKPLLTATRLAVAGNIIDLGAKSDFDLSRTINKVLAQEFKIFDYPRMVEKLSKSRSMFFLADNAGEIVFDRILLEKMLEQYGLEKITFVVKGEPTINDAMLEDAKHIGLDKLPGITFLETGPNMMRTSEPFKKLLREADIVISKGQGNYEALSEEPGIFFLLMAKCPVVARDLGEDVLVGDIIVKESQ